jgi:hypothetical protein
MVSWDKKLEIYTNGLDNAYPERMERLRNNSITATMASNKMIQNLIGKGFGEADNLRIGKIKLIDLADDVARDLVDNRGVFIQVNYDANFDISDFKVLPFNQCRVGEKDSKDYNGKILVYKDWSGKVDKKSVQILNVYNPDKKTVAYQVEQVKGIEHYKGQIFYYNMDNQYYYPLARIDPVNHDCNSEYNASIYKDNILENGFIQSTFFITRPLVDNGFIDPTDGEAIRERGNQQSERDNFRAAGKTMLGAKGTGGFMHMEVDFSGEDLSKAIEIKTVKSDVNPDLFKFVEESATRKILMAYNNIPLGLVVSDESMFGNSGDALRTMKETYWEDTWKERNLLETILNDFLKNMGNPDYTYVYIQPLFTKEVSQDTAAAENAKAQAQLKGSVGGVQALIAIQASVSAETTDYNAAVAMIVNIYGFDEETAKKLLGTPKIDPNAVN